MDGLAVGQRFASSCFLHMKVTVRCNTWKDRLIAVQLSQYEAIQSDPDVLRHSGDV